MAQTKTTPEAKLTTKQVAEKLETDARTLRRFLRSERKGVGTGNRYEFTTAQVSALKKSFAAWSDAGTEDATASA